MKLIDHFMNVDDYLNLKIDNVSDLDIATNLHIGTESLRRWKRSKGITNNLVHFTKYKRINELKSQGFNLYKIAEIMNINKRTVQNILKRF